MDAIECEYFINKLSDSASFANAQVYVKQGNQWMIGHTNTPLKDAGTLTLIETKPDCNFATQLLNGSNVSAFWLEKSHVFIVLPKVNVKSKKSTLVLFGELQKIRVAASDSYYARHDPLTGLLNRNGLESRLSTIALETIDTEDSTESEQVSKNPRSISLFSLDIDHFKQVNDSFDHATGDKVLRFFANRLRKAHALLEKAYDGDFVLTRLGGEEFELIHIGEKNGKFLEEIVASIFDAIREAVAEDDEVSNLIKAGKFPESVRASMGVAHLLATSEPISKLVTDVRHNSDLALRRAKADGRDCARFFEDIRAKHGRVVEFQNDAGIVLIDIGLEVGVCLGDLYRVSYPPYTGEKSYVKQDERSKKKFGELIKIQSAEIQVINVQDQISTCTVVLQTTTMPIPVGSLLSRRFIGSAPRVHLTRHIGINVQTDNIQSRIQEIIDSGNLNAILNIQMGFKYDNWEDHSARINEFANSLRIIFPSGTELFYAEGFNLFVVLKKKASTIKTVSAQEKTIRKLFDLLKGIENFDRIKIGCYIVPSKVDAETLNAESAMHFARSALIIARRISRIAPGFTMENFRPSGTLFAWRKRGLLEDMFADYAAFKRYGVINPRMENQIGLALLLSENANNYSQAKIAFDIAHRDAPSDLSYYVNLGISKFLLDDFDGALEIFSSAHDFVMNMSVSDYKIAYAKTAIEKWRITGEGIALIKTLTDEVKKMQPSGLKGKFYAWRQEVLKFEAVN